MSLVDSNANVDILVLDQLGNESTTEGISSTVAVDNIRLGNGDDGELLDRAVALGNDGVVDTLGEDNQTLALSIHLGQVGNVFGSRLDILWIGQAVSGGKGLGLTLVTKDNVNVWKNFIQDLCEELGNEGSREVHGEDLVVFGSVLGNLKDTLRGDGEEVAFNVVDLGATDEALVVFGPDVFSSQFLSSRQLGDKRAIVTGDQGSTGSCGNTAGDRDVFGGEAILLSSLNESVTEVVIASGSNIDNRTWGQQTLGTARSVLTGTSGNVDNIVVLDDLLIANSIFLNQISMLAWFSIRILSVSLCSSMSLSSPAFLFKLD